MNLDIAKDDKAVAMLVYPSGHTTIRFSNDLRIDIPTETLEKVIALYDSAKNQSTPIGIAVA